MLQRLPGDALGVTFREAYFKPRKKLPGFVGFGLWPKTRHRTPQHCHVLQPQNVAVVARCDAKVNEIAAPGAHHDVVAMDVIVGNALIKQLRSRCEHVR